MHIGLTKASPIRLAEGAASGLMAKITVKGPFYGSLFARNLRALIDHQCEGSVNAWAQRFGRNQTTVNRYATGMIAATMGQLEEVSEATGYAPWQLLHPEFDPRAMPPMLDARAMRVAAIFADIKDPKDKDRAEAIMEQFAAD